MTGVVSSERNTKKPDRMSGFFTFTLIALTTITLQSNPCHISESIIARIFCIDV